MTRRLPPRLCFLSRAPAVRCPQTHRGVPLDSCRLPSKGRHQSLKEQSHTKNQRPSPGGDVRLSSRVPCGPVGFRGQATCPPHRPLHQLIPRGVRIVNETSCSLGRDASPERPLPALAL